MTRPPDINQTTPREKTPYQTPKFIVIKREDNNASFEIVNPFIIKKVIDYTCCGEVTSVSKNQSGYSSCQNQRPTPSSMANETHQIPRL